MKKRVPPEVHISNRQRALKVSAAALREAAVEAARYAGGPGGAVSIVVVGDRTMRRLNKRFAKVEDTTDVLAFDMGDAPAVEAGGVSGEVIVNASLAASEAARRRRKPIEELLLYVVHGTLHLAGYGDKTPSQVRKMRNAERVVMRRLAHRRRSEERGRRNG
ncbi:MAG: rRNA maturation RNase YbeY [Planctomycetota bacterium]